MSSCIVQNTSECIVALHWPQSATHEYLRLFSPFLKRTKNNFSQRVVIALKPSRLTTSYKLQKFPQFSKWCRQMYLKEKFNDPNVVVLKLLKIKLKAHYITIDVTLSFLPHYKGNARDFVPEPDFNLVSKSLFLG